jgi:hypothetical protein
LLVRQKPERIEGAREAGKIRASRSRAFLVPIHLPEGRVLRTLRDAAE